ncbi:MAG: GNAT family acetyltransferase [Cyanobacteria bacterium P01_H01_bin.15]
MIVRKYCDGDRGDLIQLWSDAFPDDPPHNEPAKMIEAKRLVDDLIFVAVSDAQIVGACMAGYDGHRGWLYSVAVCHQWRRQGIGRKVIEEALNALRELGCIKVNLQIRATNHEVKAFYESLGFSGEERLSMGAFLD